MKTKALSLFLAVILAWPLSSGAFSTEKERELGEKLFRELQKKLEFIKDPVIKAYVEGVGDKVARASGDRRFDYHFYVVREAQPNAFTIPGGYVFVNSGLLRMLDSEDELAAVLAHEVAHSVLRHVSKMFDQAVRVSLATLAMLVAGVVLAKDAKARGAIGTGAAAMAQSIMLRYSRENEIEADQLGTSIAQKAGYRPEAMTSFLKKIYRWSRYVSPEVPSYLSTHPAVADRISYLSARFPLTEKLPPSLGLRRIQSRIVVLERGPEAVIGRLWSKADKGPDDLYSLGFAYIEASRFKEAVTPLEQLVRISPSDPYARRELGLAYYRLKEFGKAEVHLRRALNAFPSDTEVALALVQLLRLEGRRGEAKRLCKGFLNRSPDEAEFYKVLAEIQMEEGKGGNAHENFGLYFMKRGDREAALYHFRKALELARGEDKERIEALIQELTVR